MALLENVLFWISIYIAFHLLVRIYQFTKLEVFPESFSTPKKVEKTVKDITYKLNERRIVSTLLVYSLIAFIPGLILINLIDLQLGTIICVGTILGFNYLLLTPYELISEYRTNQHKKEKLLSLNALIQEDSSMTITHEMTDILISGFNSEDEKIYKLTIETLGLIKENEKVLEDIFRHNIPQSSVYDKFIQRRTPSPDSVWHYLKKIDHLPVKRRGENIQRLDDEDN